MSKVAYSSSSRPSILTQQVIEKVVERDADEEDEEE